MPARPGLGAGARARPGPRSAVPGGPLRRPAALGGDAGRAARRRPGRLPRLPGAPGHLRPSGGRAGRRTPAREGRRLAGAPALLSAPLGPRPPGSVPAGARGLAPGGHPAGLARQHPRRYPGGLFAQRDEPHIGHFGLEHQHRRRLPGRARPAAAAAGRLAARPGRHRPVHPVRRGRRRRAAVRPDGRALRHRSAGRPARGGPHRPLCLRRGHDAVEPRPPRRSRLPALLHRHAGHAPLCPRLDGGPVALAPLPLRIPGGDPLLAAPHLAHPGRLLRLLFPGRAPGQPAGLSRPGAPHAPGRADPLPRLAARAGAAPARPHLAGGFLHVGRRRPAGGLPLGSGRDAPGGDRLPGAILRGAGVVLVEEWTVFSFPLTTPWPRSADRCAGRSSSPPRPCCCSSRPRARSSRWRPCWCGRSTAPPRRSPWP